jgi:hypothetical protein
MTFLERRAALDEEIRPPLVAVPEGGLSASHLGKLGKRAF